MAPGDSARQGAQAEPYRFGDVVVDAAAHTLLRGGVEQPVEPKAFAVLLALLERPGELIGRDDLTDQIWGHQHVTPGALTRVVAQLRHALGDDSHQPRYIQTRHALGYCFIGTLQPAAASTTPAPAHAHNDDAPTRPTVDATWHPLDTARTHRTTRAPLSWRWMAVVAVIVVVVAAGLYLRPRSAPAVADASIAVMPFTSLSDDHEDDYFARGLTEEMRSALASVRGLKVAASISPAIRQRAGDARALGRILGVASVLDASVRREGAHLRISARLSDTRSGFILWSHTYDRRADDVFATQADIADEVVRALVGAIPGQTAALRKRLTPTRNAAAFDTYLQGLELLQHPDRPGALDAAANRFGQALARDGSFVLAQAGICRASTWRFANLHSPDALEAARAACERAAQMDASSAQVQLALGDLARVSGELPAALKHYAASARDAGTRVPALVGLAKVHARQGDHVAALSAFRRALQLSPGNARIHAEIGFQQYLDGHVAAALGSYRTAVRLAPDNAEFLRTLGALYMEAGDNDAAARYLAQAIAIHPTADALSNLGLIEYQAGDRAAAVDLQRRAVALDPGDYMLWGNLGDALSLEPAAGGTAAGRAYREAASRAEGYLKLRPADSLALASLGLYRAHLGDAGRAHALVRQSETSPAQPGEVALINAETLAVLGELAAARSRLATARDRGIVEQRIHRNPIFRRRGLTAAASGSTPAPATTTAPPATAEQPRGE